MKNPMFYLLWVCSATGLVLAYYKFLGRQWVPAVLLLVISASVILMSVWLLQFLNKWEVPLIADQSLTSTGAWIGQITMQVSGQTLGEPLRWAVGCLMGALFLSQYPDTLWKSWLSYSAALLLTIAVIVMLLLVMTQKFIRIVADSNGIEVRSEVRNVASKTDSKVAWRDVGSVKMIDYYINSATQYQRNRPDSFEKTLLVFFDRQGKELLSLDDPLAPPHAYQRFLEAIPAWTKLTIQKERVVKKL